MLVTFTAVAHTVLFQSFSILVVSDLLSTCSPPGACRYCLSSLLLLAVILGLHFCMGWVCPVMCSFVLAILLLGSDDYGDAMYEWTSEQL